MRFIAGHSFPEFGACACGIHWTTIRNATAADAHQTGIAHSGLLSTYELDQIIAERAAEDGRIALAMTDLAA